MPSAPPGAPTPVPGSRPSDGWTGGRADHFEVERLLGRGGMGAVFVARDVSLDRRVALKILPADLGASPELEERFVREARAQARLQSPHVVHIYYIGRTTPQGARPGSLFFAMELVDGEALDAPLERGERLAPEDARRLMIEVAEGLREAHVAGIIHRDVKPSNLLRDARGHVKIADFGLAKPVEGDAQITQEGVVVGSPLYMAPEQARGDPVDARADMYALGCTFHHLIAGRPPFEGPNPLAIVSRRLTSPAPPLAERAPAAPAVLCEIVDRLLRADPADRFASYDDLIAALHAAAPQATEYAGFWTRGAAVTIDVALAALLVAVASWVGIAAHLAYVTIAHAFWGQTAGKYLLRIRVGRLDGRPLGLPRAAARTIASLWHPFLVGLIIVVTHGKSHLRMVVDHLQPTEQAELRELLLAFLAGHALLTLLFAAGLGLAAIHPQKRAIHDLLVGSVVTYRLAGRR